jgi:hypothetical protein
MVGNQTATIIAGTNYNGFKAINDGVDLAITDVHEAADRETDGDTYPQYCYAGTTVCTPGARRCRDSNTVEQCRADGSGWDVVQTCGTGYTCQNGSCVATAPPTTDTTVGPFEFEFGEVCTGDPTATIDVSGLKMWQETDTFRMNNFMVTNTSNCIAYFATQLKFWPLTTTVPSTCPTTTPEWSGMDRSTWTPGDPYLEIATIAPGETKEIWMDFFVPATTRGRKVLCMDLWANFIKWDLYDELADRSRATYF